MDSKQDGIHTQFMDLLLLQANSTFLSPASNMLIVQGPNMYCVFLPLTRAQGPSFFALMLCS